MQVLEADQVAAAGDCELDFSLEVLGPVTADAGAPEMCCVPIAEGVSSDVASIAAEPGDVDGRVEVGDGRCLLGWGGLRVSSTWEEQERDDERGRQPTVAQESPPLSQNELLKHTRP